VVLGPQKGPKNSLKLLYLAVLGGFSPINHGFDPKNHCFHVFSLIIGLK
jgi:hypothetical protein